jgi:hypothetical protein
MSFFSSFGQLRLGYLLPMSAKETKTSAELKLLIERELLRDHPECMNAEVIINPPEGMRPWGASIYGKGPTIDRNCRSRIESIVAELRDKFDLAVER